MGDYAALYARLMAAGAGAGAGAGMGGPGIGEGGVAPEDETTKSDFKSEQSKSALTAGKILLQWKTQGMSDAGAAQQNYMEKVAAVKQGASEAVLQEQVPPGYHQAISKYFDTIGEGLAKPSGQQ